jgi:hypothetical protein
MNTIISAWDSMKDVMVRPFVQYHYDDLLYVMKIKKEYVE